MRRETWDTYKYGLVAVVPVALIGLRVCTKFVLYAEKTEARHDQVEQERVIEKKLADLEAAREQEARGMERAKLLPKASTDAKSDALAAGQAMPAAVATDKEHVYWLNLKSGDVMALGLGGGEPKQPKVLAHAQKLVHQRHAQTLAAADGTAYYLTDSALEKVSAGGGEPEVLVDDLASPTALAIDKKTLFFCALASNADAGSDTDDGGPSGGLYQLAPHAKAAKLVAKFEHPTAVALDASYAYVVDASSVVRIPKAGGEPLVLASSTGRFGTTLAVDQHDVYYTLPSDDSVMKTKKQGGSDSAVVAMERERPVAVALFGDSLYSLTETAPQALGEMGTVWRARTDGAGSPEALVIDQPGLNDLAVAEGEVYYTTWDEDADDGHVMRVKPGEHASADGGMPAKRSP